MLEVKEEMVFEVTDGRTNKVTEMTSIEASDFIYRMMKIDPETDSNNRMRNKIIALAYQAAIISGTSKADIAINYHLLDNFLLAKGVVKKRLQKLSHQELIMTVSQFQKLLANCELKNAKKATDNLLKELNLKTQKSKSNVNH